MRILLDVGHPAHVHYSKNFIKILESKGHNFIIIARNRDVIFKLLKNEKIKYFNRGKGSSTLFGKFFYMLYADLFIIIKSLRFHPDVFLSFGSPYAAHVSRLFKKPHIAIVDTEHPKLGNLSFFPFTDIILTPECYFKNLGNKQIKFKSYLELCYLHPKRFSPDINILNELHVKPDEKYVIIRFVSWTASHDFGHKGLDIATKINLVNEISKYAKVFISSETILPQELLKYKINIPATRLHHALAFATLYIGEGATTASECAVLGTPNIYINSLVVGYCKEQEEKYGLCFHIKNQVNIVSEALSLLNNIELKEIFHKRRLKMLEETIDLTSFLCWFIENYPDSISIMKYNSNFQMKFK